MWLYEKVEKIEQPSKVTTGWTVASDWRKWASCFWVMEAEEMWNFPFKNRNTICAVFSVKQCIFTPSELRGTRTDPRLQVPLTNDKWFQSAILWSLRRVPPGSPGIKLGLSASGVHLLHQVMSGPVRDVLLWNTSTAVIRLKVGFGSARSGATASFL